MAGEIQLNSTSFASESGGTITINNATLASAVDLSNHYASTSEVQGVHTTATTAKATNANQLTSVTAVSGYSLADVSVGDYVTGEGILVGTTVSVISGTTITLYHPDGDALSSSMTDLSGDPVSFYNSTKALSAGTVAGGLCRAWVNFNGTGTVAIRAAYNVSSITDNGGSGGDYTVNFATAMPDANYAVQGSLQYARLIFGIQTIAAGSVRVTSFDEGSSYFDAAIVCLAIFR